MRFFNKLKKNEVATGVLTPDELTVATTIIIKEIQSRSYPEEFLAFKDDVKDNKRLVHSKLLKLDPFIDSKGLLRVGGRLKNAPIAYDHKFPIILPEHHHVTQLILRDTHERELHSGNQATLCAVRQTYWPVGGRNLIRKLIHSCVKCTRVKPKLSNQKMGNLPVQRLQPVRPFYISGVDYAGPFLIKEGKTRKMRKVKAYIALFICFSTKAIHLELVGDLTSDSFLGCMKRFIARRGNVAEIFSDNGTNFTGAERLMFESFRSNLPEHVSNNKTKFHFIPPRSPHFGGLWERAVRSVKHHLHRVMGDASLTYEEFYTLLTGIEACLNSRPITPLSLDPHDLDALTPGHFLIGAPLTAPIEDDVRAIPLTRLSRWQRVQNLRQHFWQRWQREYLQQLQQRPKGQQSASPNITPGTMVVLVEDNLPPLRWKLGRVVDVHPGQDGIVRVVTVKTASGTTRRSVKKVCILPVSE